MSNNRSNRREQTPPSASTRERWSPVQWSENRSYSTKKSSSSPRQPSAKDDNSIRSCNECKKKPPQVECLHCSQHVCLECAQKHVDLVSKESDGAAHLLNEKLDIIDRIAANTKQRIVVERDKIVQSADAERDRAFAVLTQMANQEKQKLRDKNSRLGELPLNQIQGFIQQMKADLGYLTEKNDHLFIVRSRMPQITLQHQDERLVQRSLKPSEKIYSDDEDLYQ